MKKISKKDIEDALSKTNHPEISYSLLKLGMIKNINVEKENVSLTLALPFLEIPIKEDLINIIKESLNNLNKNIKTKIKTAEMDEKEKKKFMNLAREGWIS